MSRNSKTARNLRAAKQISSQRKNGGKGPAKTTKKNTKKNTWFANLAAGRPVRSNTKKKDEEVQE